MKTPWNVTDSDRNMADIYLNVTDSYRNMTCNLEYDRYIRNMADIYSNVAYS